MRIDGCTTQHFCMVVVCACNSQINQGSAGLWRGADLKRVTMTRDWLMNGAGTVQDGSSDDWRLQGDRTCLQAASSAGHVDVVEHLIEVGGKELLMSTDRVSALALCCG